MNPLRFVLFHRQGAPPPEEVARLKRCAGIEVLDDSGRALLVSASPERVLALRAEFPDWTIHEERTYPGPTSPRPRRRDE